MHRILQFYISYEDGAYTADCINAPIVTFSRTFEELAHKIREAVAAFFHNERPEALGFTPSPTIVTSFELPTIAHGGQERKKSGTAVKPPQKKRKTWLPLHPVRVEKHLRFSRCLLGKIQNIRRVRKRVHARRLDP